MGNLIREGYEIKVIDMMENNITMPTLVRIALDGLLTSKQGQSDDLVEALSEIIDEPTLIEVIECGCIENYLIRKKRGFSCSQN